MPQGDKSSYTDKQKRKAEHIEEGYEKRGTSKKEAERRAWATVNKEEKAAGRLAPVAERNRTNRVRVTAAEKAAKLRAAGRRPPSYSSIHSYVPTPE